MKKMLVLTALVLTTTGCPNDDAGSLEARKGVVDEGDLVDGVTVTLNGSLGEVALPFSTEVPDVADNDFQDEMEGAVSLLVMSPSGAAADIMAGTLVSGTPDSPGEFNWDLNASRDEAAMTFFNETPGGLTLKPEVVYTTQFAVAVNEYVERVSAIAFEVTVEEG